MPRRGIARSERLGRIGRRTRLLLGAAGCLALTLVLALVVGFSRSPPALDRNTARWVHDNRIDALDPAWRTVALLGGSAALGALILTAGVIAWRRLGPRWLTFLVGAFAGTQVIFWSMKLVVDRPRPPLSLQLATVASPSFPSGHTAIATAVGASLLVVAAQTTRTLARRVAFAALFALPLIVGLSRLALGVHWLTDVIGGALLGFGWVLAWAALVAPSNSPASRIGRERSVRPFADTRR